MSALSLQHPETEWNSILNEELKAQYIEAQGLAAPSTLSCSTMDRRLGTSSIAINCMHSSSAELDGQAG